MAAVGAAFLKAASQSALAHHVAEVTATERYHAALGGHFEIEVLESRRLDGEPTEAVATYKVGRKTKREPFGLLGSSS